MRGDGGIGAGAGMTTVGVTPGGVEDAMAGNETWETRSSAYAA